MMMILVYCCSLLQVVITKVTNNLSVHFKCGQFYLYANYFILRNTKNPSLSKSQIYLCSDHFFYLLLLDSRTSAKLAAFDFTKKQLGFKVSPDMCAAQVCMSKAPSCPKSFSDFNKTKQSNWCFSSSLCKCNTSHWNRIFPQS